jgi:hypothetical protein
MSAEGGAQDREAIISRIEPLLAAGDALQRAQSDGGWYSREFHGGLAGWIAQSTTAIMSIVGSDHPYYSNFIEDTKHESPTDAARGTAILLALKQDVENGYLRRQADLVAASVFSDFLDMAGYLLEEGYFHAAASIIGAVVEDGLRRMAITANVPVKPRDDINALSSKLRQKGVFTPLVAKRITLWAEIRNHADHAEWAKVTKVDVDEMYKAVVAFMAERLG